MTIKEFVDNYNKQLTDQLKKKYIDNNIEVKKYISISVKMDVCNRIINACNYDSNNKFRSNSLGRYILHVMNMINLYTNIEVDFTNITDEYDVLKESGLLGIIHELIDKDEREEFQCVMDMTYSDEMINNHEIHNFVNDQIDKLSLSFGTIIDGINDIISNGQIDKETLINKLL